MPKLPLAWRIKTTQERYVRSMNNLHLVGKRVVMTLKDLETELSASTRQGARKYLVPGATGTQQVERKDKELASVFGSHADTRIYQSFLVTAVSDFEAFLSKVIEYVLREYPRKLTIAVQGVSTGKDIPIGVVLDAETIAETIDWAIERALHSLFYASPVEYLAYLKKVVSINTSKPQYQDYFEIKATRDLIIHNSGVINATYLTKAGEKARGESGAAVEVDKEYFEHCLAVLKRLSWYIRSDAEKEFRPKAKAK